MGFDIMVVRIVVHIFKRDPNDVRIPISDGKYRFMSRIPLIQKTTRTTGYARHLPIPSSEAILRIVTSRISMIQSRYIVNATYEVNAMGKRLRIYVTDMDKALNMKNMSEEELAALRAEMCVQIGFFQHERLVHLLVTLAFALLTMIAVLGCLLRPGILCFVLAGLFFVLLIPYMLHYYTLENGVQKLYVLYDRACQKPLPQN